MKKVEFLKDIKTQSDSKIQTIKEDFLREDFNLRMRKGTESLKKNHIFKEIRRKIAQINTILSSRNKKR